MPKYAYYHALLLALLILVSGCVSLQAVATVAPMVHANDLVSLNYSCFLEDGSLAATTEASVAEDPVLVKAPHFKPRSQYGPARLHAGNVRQLSAAKTDQVAVETSPMIGFEDVLENQLAARLNGFAYRVEETIHLAAGVDDSLIKEARYLERRRILQPMKTVKIMRQNVAAQLGKEPAPGMRIEENGSHFLEVLAVEGDTVVLHRLLHDGMSFMTPYGPARVVDDHEEHFTLIFDIRENMAVRTGAQVGRVTGITDDKYLLDYGDPFGGASLDCKVRIEQVNDAERSISPTSGGDNTIHLQPEASGANGKEGQADAQ